MGGGFFADDKEQIMWHAEFPEDIQERILVLLNDPTSELTNSNLEQAGVLAQADMANMIYDLWNWTLATFNDNMAAVSHNRKGVVTSNQAGAYLCQMSSLHCRHHRYCHEVLHMSREAQEMANMLSRHHDLTDEQLLTLFDFCFPQDKSWHMCHLPDEMLLDLNCLLRHRRPAAALYL
jgi:hypothetical protein